MRLLLISNSTMAGQPYLDYPKQFIKDFLGQSIKKVLFIPYAGVTFSYDEYHRKVSLKFAEIGYEVESIHQFANPVEAVKNAEAIVTGGGNTFHLVHQLHANHLIEIIREKVLAGTPFVGWSAGANVACPTLRTTNDMPIIQPASFNTFNLVPFQINPHYLDANPDGHAGETREARIEEFIEINPDVYVAGLREGCMFRIEGREIRHIGDRSCRIFKKGKAPVELQTGDDFSFLL
ncbi:MAG: dipeptidase PepE [Bacteroidales bacterium]|nr:dipeptidase PepE [Bacteroidales bacterium]